jgi:sugar/nucleoside kinase (ribokinase family)
VTGHRFRRLLHLGNVVIDIVLDVPALPERGGDVLATRTEFVPGGGFNVLVAAARQGLPVSYGGALGQGPLADLARRALADEGIAVLQPPQPSPDTGFVISLVDAAGERTFVTSPGAEARLTRADLARVTAGPDDAVYLSGYGLVHPANREALLGWLAGRPALARRPGRADRPGLADGSVVIFDPGPLVASIPADALAAVAHRADWVTCNAREAAWLAGQPEPAAALRALTRHPPWAARAGQGVLVRAGPAGCLLAHFQTEPVVVPGFPVTALDTNGAGDTHTGAFIAALATGVDELQAARRANAAAAMSVTRRGPATAPTATELVRFLSRQSWNSSPRN